MKFKYFSPKTVEFQTRLLASHLPSGRAWNSKTGRGLWKLLLIMGSGAFEISRMIQTLIFEFRIESSVEFLSLWEESLSMETNPDMTIQERRDAIKAQYRKITVVNRKEWEDVIGTAIGRAVSVYPAKDFDITDERFLFPYTFPIYFYRTNPVRIKQNRFVLYVDSVTASEKVIVEKIVRKFKPSFVRVVYILE